MWTRYDGGYSACPTDKVNNFVVKLVLLLHSLIVYFQVHDMMDDIAEQQDVAKEISEAISNPGKFQTIIINRMNRGRKL